MDLFAIFMLLVIATLAGKVQSVAGSSIIDTSNLNYRDDINRAKSSIILKCDIQVDADDDELNAQNFNQEIPVMIVNPG